MNKYLLHIHCFLLLHMAACGGKSELVITNDTEIDYEISLLPSGDGTAIFESKLLGAGASTETIVVDSDDYALFKSELPHGDSIATEIISLELKGENYIFSLKREELTEKTSQ